MYIVIKRLNNMENGQLNISHLNLTQLPDSPLWKNVKRLYCHNNKLTTLPDLPKVKTLYCDNNQLTSLPDLPKVKTLYCDNNQLTSLPDLPNVKGLECDNNRLTCLPDLPKVKNLYCSNNQLTRLSDLPNVEYLYWYNNRLIHKPKNRKIFNALFRIISAQKLFKHWREIVHQRRQEKAYQNINKMSEFDILPEEIKLYIVKFI